MTIKLTKKQEKIKDKIYHSKSLEIESIIAAIERERNKKKFLDDEVANIIIDALLEYKKKYEHRNGNKT